MWSPPLSNVMAKLPPQTRVFVISVVGLKGSRKSSLLNHLFGPGFREATVEGTTGLVFRLHWLEEELQKRLRVDAFILIDSEGFGAQENTLDERADLAERRLAAFLLGISHLTIVNVLGKSMGELSGVIETSMSSLSCLEKLILTPDTLLVQQDTEPDQSSSPVLSEFSSSVEASRAFTQAHELEVGVRVREDRRLEAIKHRLKHTEAFFQIRVKETGHVHFDADILSLYREIIEACARSREIQPLATWYAFTRTFWTTLESREGPNKYPSVPAARQSINLKARIEQLRRAFDAAFRSHETLIDSDFQKKAEELFKKTEEGLAFNPQFADVSLTEVEATFDADYLRILTTVHSSLRKVVNSCDIAGSKESKTACKLCLNAFKLREALFADLEGVWQEKVYEEAVNDYLVEARESLMRRWRQALTALELKNGMSTELENALDDILEGKEGGKEAGGAAWKRFKQYISTKQLVVPATQQIQAEAQEAYPELPHIFPHLSTPDLPNLETIMAFDIGHYNNALESALNAPKALRLSWSQNDWLLSQIEDMPSKILADNGTSTYRVGMTRELRDRVSTVLKEFEGICLETLLPDFKWEVHLLALKTMVAQMAEADAAWDQSNNPLVQLESRKEEFPNIFP
jgi:hypothetical protein